MTNPEIAPTKLSRISIVASLAAVAIIATGTLLSGCLVKSLESDDPGDGVGEFEGRVDPGSGSIVLRSMATASDGTPIRIELIGHFVDDSTTADRTFLSVAVHNIDTRTLYAPGEISIRAFRPTNVRPVLGYADWVACANSDPNGGVGCFYGYVYSGLLGGDGMLEPGELSGEKLIVFDNPGGESFSFNVSARFALQPDRPRIAGHFFSDINGNGIWDDDEAPFGGGYVRISPAPVSGSRQVPVDGDGYFEATVSSPGLYNLEAFPPPTFAPVEPTTPNPLEVVIVRDRNGDLRSFLDADFGWRNSFDSRPVGFVDVTDSLRLDSYQLLGAHLSGMILTTRIAFSGCSPDDFSQLYMVGGFMESFPVQARLLLDHHGTACAAHWETTIRWNLAPIMRLYEEGYGRRDLIILRFETADGQEHRFELFP